MHKEIITFESGLQVYAHILESENRTTLHFLHGLGNTEERFIELATLLSVNYRVLAIDLSGYGGSIFIDEEKFFSAELPGK